jgi:hypothetical protein
MSTIPRQRQIDIVAFRIWLERGCPTGSSRIYWQEAEKELFAATLPDELTARRSKRRDSNCRGAQDSF